MLYGVLVVTLASCSITASYKLLYCYYYYYYYYYKLLL